MGRPLRGDKISSDVKESAICEYVRRGMDVLGSSHGLCKGPEAEKTCKGHQGLSRASFPICPSGAGGAAGTWVRKDHCVRLSNGPQRHLVLFLTPVIVDGKGTLHMEFGKGS